MLSVMRSVRSPNHANFLGQVTEKLGLDIVTFDSLICRAFVRQVSDIPKAERGNNDLVK